MEHAIYAALSRLFSNTYREEDGSITAPIASA
jgi:hypothetical protein